jgi:glycine cleavage system H protein
MKRYTPSHEWIEISGDTGTVGISGYAQKELGSIVFADLPSIGKEVSMGDEIVILESTKAAADIYSPASGSITAVNKELEKDLASLNEDPEASGWLFKIKITNQEEVEELLSEEEYLRMVLS